MTYAITSWQCRHAHGRKRARTSTPITDGSPKSGWREHLSPILAGDALRKQILPGVLEPVGRARSRGAAPVLNVHAEISPRVTCFVGPHPLGAA